MNSNLITGMLFLHVRKAFDSLIHRLLLHKLRKIGPSRTILTWFESYLNNGYAGWAVTAGIPVKFGTAHGRLTW